MGSAADGLSILLALKNLEQQHRQHEYQLRKLNKLHERLVAKEGLLSMAGAAKFFKAYEGAVEGATSHLQAIRSAKGKIDGWLCQFDMPAAVSVVEPSMSSEPADSESSSLPLAAAATATAASAVPNPLIESDIEMEIEMDIGMEMEMEMQMQMDPEMEASVRSAQEIMDQQQPESGEHYHDALLDESTGLALNVDVESVGETIDSERGTQASDLSPLQTENTLIEPGSPVAVFCRADPESRHEDWILATLIRHIPETGEYEVEDVEFVDPLASPSKIGRANALRLIVPIEMVQRLPASETEALRLTEHIRMRQEVLALFPGTTCLYPAVVMNTPSRRKKTQNFLVKFKDDDVPHRPVPARYIIPIVKK